MFIPRIYINDSALEVRQEKPPTGASGITFDELSKRSLPDFIFHIAKEQPAKCINIWGESNEKVISYFEENLTLLEAGGGIVQNTEGKFLFIFRNGRWDFPKGKPEKQESIEKTAIREVEEECGIGGLKILSSLPETYHIYFNEKNIILKKCLWFHMSSSEWQRTRLQKEEGITDFRWLSIPFPNDILDHAYPSITDLSVWFQDYYLSLLRSC